VVVKKYKESGESVDRAEKLLDIVNIDEVYVQFYVDPKLLSVIKENQMVPVRFPVIGERKFDGKVGICGPAD
jgi:hypothetical protein